MARFDVYHFTNGVPFVLDVQADVLGHIGSRVVIPLVAAEETQREAMPRLKPLLQINGTSYRMITTDIATVPVSHLRECIASVGDQRDTIIDAIDFLLQGF